MKENIAIIGEKNFIYGFQGLSVDIFGVQNQQEARQMLEELVKQTYPIIYITETYARDILDLIEHLNKISSSSIVIIPGTGVTEKLGDQQLKNIIRKAVGTEIINSGGLNGQGDNS